MGLSISQVQRTWLKEFVVVGCFLEMGHLVDSERYLHFSLCEL